MAAQGSCATDLEGTNRISQRHFDKELMLNAFEALITKKVIGFP